MKFLELCQKGMDTLETGLNMKAFHRVILTNGSLPLTILEKLVDSFTGGTA